jgi:hypothetical protein
MNIATWKSLSERDQKKLIVLLKTETKILDYTVQRAARSRPGNLHTTKCRTHESNATLNVTFDDDSPPIEVEYSRHYSNSA